MTKDEHVKYWIESAQHDLHTAQSMFEAARFDWCLFVGHLVLEKSLKAVYVDRNNSAMPPKIHNLVRLAEISKIELDDKRKSLIDKITDFNIQTRYPDYKFTFYKRCTKEYTEEYFDKIKELHTWFRSLIK